MKAASNVTKFDSTTSKFSKKNGISKRNRKDTGNYVKGEGKDSAVFKRKKSKMNQVDHSELDKVGLTPSFKKKSTKPNLKTNAKESPETSRVFEKKLKQKNKVRPGSKENLIGKKSMDTANLTQALEHSVVLKKKEGRERRKTPVIVPVNEHVAPAAIPGEKLKKKSMDAANLIQASQLSVVLKKKGGMERKKPPVIVPVEEHVAPAAIPLEKLKKKSMDTANLTQALQHSVVLKMKGGRERKKTPVIVPVDEHVAPAAIPLKKLKKKDKLKNYSKENLSYGMSAIVPQKKTKSVEKSLDLLSKKSHNQSVLPGEKNNSEIPVLSKKSVKKTKSDKTAATHGPTMPTNKKNKKNKKDLNFKQTPGPVLLKKSDKVTTFAGKNKMVEAKTVFVNNEDLAGASAGKVQKASLKKKSMLSSDNPSVSTKKKIPTALSPSLLGKRKRKDLLTSTSKAAVRETENENTEMTPVGHPAAKKQKRELMPEVVDKVSSAILKLVNESQNSPNQLLAESMPVLMQFLVFKIPNTPFRHIRCKLPHSIFPSEPDVCLIVPDMERGRKSDEELGRVTQTYSDLVQEHGVSAVKEVIPFARLRAEYGPFEMKRRLAKSFDLFLCDGRIHGHVVNFLGKIFEKTKKIPIPVQIVESTGPESTKLVPNLKNVVESALHKVYFSLHNHGTSFTVPVGHSLLTKEQLSENITTLWEKINAAVPGGIANIRSVYLKGSSTVGIPLYASLVPLKYVPAANLKKMKPVKGELSTNLGRKVLVFPSGKVKVLSNPTQADAEFIKHVDGDPPSKKRRKRKQNDADDASSDDEEDVNLELGGEGSALQANSAVGVSKDENDSDKEEDVDNAEDAYLLGLQ